MSFASENVSVSLPSASTKPNPGAAAAAMQLAGESQVLFELGSRFGATAACVLHPQHRRWALRLTVNGHYIRSQWCQSRDEAIAECKRWLTDMQRRGWLSSAQ